MQPEPPCTVTGAGGSYVDVYESAAPDAKPLLDVAEGEDQVFRLGPRAGVGAERRLKIRYDDIVGWIDARYLACRLSPAEARQQIETRARDAVVALKAYDMEHFSRFVHPVKGVRFSPYAYVEPSQDLVFSPTQVAGLQDDMSERLWGYYDGSGDPITLGFPGYYRRFVFDRDYSTAGNVAYNNNRSEGNTQDNSFEIYPGAIVVEFYVAGTGPAFQGADWRLLRLVFERHGEQWYVVGVVHGEWTI